MMIEVTALCRRRRRSDVRRGGWSEAGGGEIEGEEKREPSHNHMVISETRVAL